MRHSGFTLIELIIVVAIIAIVASLALPNLMMAIQKGKQKSSMAEMKLIGTAIEAYIIDISIAPNVSDNIANFNESWFVPMYLKKIPFYDGWGNVFAYIGSTDVITASYSIGSSGRNGSGMVEWDQTGEYDVRTLMDFDNDIIFSNGIFTYCPRVKESR